MAYTQLPTRTSADANASADVNTLQGNIEALKGGAGATAPVNTLADIVPPGTILPYAGATAPTGYLLCDGKTIGRDVGDTIFPDSSGSGAPDYYDTKYSALYAILSEASARWETPAGTATWGTHKIKLPNLQDAFPRGEVGGASSIFTDSTKRSAGLGKKQDDAMQGHNTTFELGAPAGGATGGSIIGSSNAGSGWATSPNAFRATTPITDGVNGTPRTATESRPKNIGVNYIIKY
jgi:hypothetical protein